MSATAIEDTRPAASAADAGRLGLYAFLVISALFFLLPLYVMMVTSLKAMPEIRQGNLLALPSAPSIAAWIKAWSSACTGLTCDGIRVGFLNSVRSCAERHPSRSRSARSPATRSRSGARAAPSSCSAR